MNHSVLISLLVLGATNHLRAGLLLVSVLLLVFFLVGTSLTRLTEVLR